MVYKLSKELQSGDLAIMICISELGFLSLDSGVWRPGLEFLGVESLGLESWSCIPGFRFLA